MKKYTRIFLIARNWKLSKCCGQYMYTLDTAQQWEWMIYHYTEDESHWDNNEWKKTEAKYFVMILKQYMKAGKTNLSCWSQKTGSP